MEQNLICVPPDLSDEEVRWLCSDAITDLKFRESNAKSSFLERNRTNLIYSTPENYTVHVFVSGSFRFV